MVRSTQEEERRNDPVAERDFYRRLLELGNAVEPEPLLEQALQTIVSATGAKVAYLELRAPDEDADGAPRYWRAHGCSDDDVASIRRAVSRGIVARAIAEGRTIVTPCAVEDPSFRDQPSVLRNAIQAVICAPIGKPATGVVYLQAARAGASFVASNVDAVELFARQLSAVYARCLPRGGGGEPSDATVEIRKHFRCDGVIGKSAALAQALTEAAQVSPLPITVFITGPVGTGKSALARAIASNSPRAAGPYVDLNCAAIPENLLEGELFGTEPGAYTGARKMPGKVAAARGGTLFLDEVAELSMGAQAKLLQLLQERRYYPLGSTTPLTADVRVISATNANLKERVVEKRFREDLYYRLAVMTIEMPGLSHRREDIPDLVRHFCAEACKRLEISEITPTRRVLFSCAEHAWPGNVRELGNAIEAAVARASYERSQFLDEHHVFPSSPRRDGAPPTLREATQKAQRRHVDEALQRNEWNVTRTATELDVNRQYLHELMNTLGLRRKDR